MTSNVFFLRLRQSGQRRAKGRLSCYVEIFKKKKLFVYIKQIDSMLHGNMESIC